MRIYGFDTLDMYPTVGRYNRFLQVERREHNAIHLQSIFSGPDEADLAYGRLRERGLVEVFKFNPLHG